MEHPLEQLNHEAPPTPTRRYNVERSCIRCHERKVRCNKAVPCSTCLRAKFPCQYPASQRIERRSKRQSLAAVVPRLESLERAVAMINQRKSPGAWNDVVGSTQCEGVYTSSPEVVPRTQGMAADRKAPSEHTKGFLVKEGASTRYINELLFSRVLEKVRTPCTSGTWFVDVDLLLGRRKANFNLSVTVQQARTAVRADP